MQEYALRFVEDGCPYFTEKLDKTHAAGDITVLAKKYRKFRVAYVDKNGNVLGMTNAVNAKSSSRTLYEFQADGDKLSLNYTVAEAPQRALAMFILRSVGIVLLILLLLTALLIRRSIQKVNKNMR